VCDPQNLGNKNRSEDFYSKLHGAKAHGQGGTIDDLSDSQQDGTNESSREDSDAERSYPIERSYFSNILNMGNSDDSNMSLYDNSTSMFKLNEVPSELDQHSVCESHQSDKFNDELSYLLQEPIQPHRRTSSNKSFPHITKSAKGSDRQSEAGSNCNPFKVTSESGKSIVD